MQRNYRTIRSGCHRLGFTLVELLVVIAIIGILVALLLPAIQAAREAARRTQCKNNVKNIALGCLLHVDTQGYYPSGGWSKEWTADANRGYGPRQPGSWQYNILTYVEESALHDLGKGLAATDANFRLASIKLHQAPVPLFSCPSRRVSRPYKTAWGSMFYQGWIQGTAAREGVIKSDYAASSGDAHRWSGDPPMATPSTYTQADTTMSWTETSKCNVRDAAYDTCQTGVMYYHSDVKTSQISDGTSHTYLAGEKYLATVDYAGDTGTFGDNQGIYSGYEWDNHRVAYNPTYGTAAEFFQPRQDNPGSTVDQYYAFGSPHSGGLNMAMCDGSTQTVSYDIDSTVHRWLANRLDGNVAATQ